MCRVRRQLQTVQLFPSPDTAVRTIQFRSLLESLHLSLVSALLRLRGGTPAEADDALLQCSHRTFVLCGVWVRRIHVALQMRAYVLSHPSSRHASTYVNAQ